MRTNYKTSYPMRLEEVLPCSICGGLAYWREGEAFAVMHEYECSELGVKGAKIRAYSKNELGIYKWNQRQRAKAHRLTNAWRLTGKPVHANAEDGTSPC